MTDTSGTDAASAATKAAVHDSDSPGTITLTLKDANLADTVADQGQVPSWSASPDGIVTLTPAADGMSAQVSYDSPGDVTVTVTLTDADGKEVQIPTLALSVAAGEPLTGVLAFTPAEVTPAAPAPTPAVATDPANGKPLYTYVGTGIPDPTAWPVATDVTGANGETLYTFSGDTAGQAPTGTGADWQPYTGTTQPASAAPAPAPGGIPTGGTGGTGPTGTGTGTVDALDPNGFTTKVIADPTRW